MSCPSKRTWRSSVRPSIPGESLAGDRGVPAGQVRRHPRRPRGGVWQQGLRGCARRASRYSRPGRVRSGRGGNLRGRAFVFRRGGSLAQGRPDQADIAKASAFGRMVRERLAYTGSVREAALLKVPGNIPYRERMTLKMLSGTADDLCTGCGVCLERCPGGDPHGGRQDHDRQGRLHPLLRLREELSHRGEATGRSGVPGGS